MRFKYVNKCDGEMVDTPYAADRKSCTIFTNPKLARNLSTFEKKFWILHEKGHIILDTDDEIAADNYAFNKLAGTEYRSLKQMIEAEENLLNANSPYHQARIDNLYARALDWDRRHPIKLNKATSKQITALGTQFNNAILQMGTMMNAQTQTTQEGLQQKDDSNNTLLIVIAIAVIAFFILKK